MQNETHVNSICNVADFGFAMVRPDGLELSLDEPILNRIESAGLHVVKRKLFKISSKQVDEIYADLTDRGFYRDFKESLVGKYVMGAIVGGEEGVSSNLMSIKGSVWDYHGTVRGDFSLAHYLDGRELELFKAGQLGEDCLKPEISARIMRYDRMHCEENAPGARKAMRSVYEAHELEEAASRYAQLAHFLNASSRDSDSPLNN